jgi:phthalate 4,5-dioxygenase oxygenase subunit
MITAEENDLLCRVAGPAPMGQLMRRHWMPVCLSEEVADNDGTPVHARVLGEDLVVFRDTEGRLGVLDGLRCLYHGWKVDVAGNVLEMASEPQASGLCEKVKHLAYPCEEAGGFVWAYMGPKDEVPPFERPAFAPTPGTRVSIVKVHVNANWAQILEGAIDSAHSSSLHSTDMPPARVDGAKATEKVWPRPSTDKAPRLQLEQTPFGFRYAAIRRPIVSSSTHDYIRVSLFVAPYTVLIPPNNMYNLANVNVPMDDTNTMFYFIAWSDTGPGIDVEAWRKFCGAQPGVDLDGRWRKHRTYDNFFLQDRQAMKLGDFTGIRGIPMQDMAMWETMGPIADRTRERLGASDLAIVEFRRIMVDAVRRFAAGGAAIGTAGAGGSKAGLRSFEGIVAKGTDWRSLGAAPGERALQEHGAE